MTKIILELCYSPEGKYLGMISIDDSELTPDFINAIKTDIDDVQGWKKYRKVMKDKGFDIGVAEI